MATHTLKLTDKQAEIIDRRVQSGRYRNAGDVLHAGLRLLEQRDAEAAAKLATRRAIQVGSDDMEAARYTTFATAEEIREHIANRTRRGRRRDGVAG